MPSSDFVDFLKSKSAGKGVQFMHTRIGNKDDGIYEGRTSLASMSI